MMLAEESSKTRVAWADGMERLHRQLTIYMLLSCTCYDLTPFKLSMYNASCSCLDLPPGAISPTLPYPAIGFQWPQQ